MRSIQIQADDGTFQALERLAAGQSKSIERLAQEVLARYAKSLAKMDKRPAVASSEPYRVRTFSVGRIKVDDLSNVAEVLARAEGEDYQ